MTGRTQMLDRVMDIEELAAQGEIAERIAERLHITLPTLDKTLRRYGRAELSRQLHVAAAAARTRDRTHRDRTRKAPPVALGRPVSDSQREAAELLATLPVEDPMTVLRRQAVLGAIPNRTHRPRGGSE